MISLFDKKFTLLFSKLININAYNSGISTYNINNSVLNNTIYPYFKELLEKDNNKISKITKDFTDTDYDIWVIRYENKPNNHKYNIDEFKSAIRSNNISDLIYDFIIPFNSEQTNVFRIKDTLNFFIDTKYLSYLDNDINKKALDDTIYLFNNILSYITEKEDGKNSPNLLLTDINIDNDYKFTSMNGTYVTSNNKKLCLTASIYHMYKILLRQDYFGGETLIDNMYNNSDILNTIFKDKYKFTLLMSRINKI